ncbi:MAG: hypothetical protein PWP10_3021 [Clostridiales bacterium]|nr:hypothetical protein [Eubacteriales bacterium]MDD3198438.1 hypothetical protein [Eubacteriales bacterium]MDD3502834.1 hypothetical protein [Eubacteriales bacterium]MDD4682781.1 hypothetical protein [Eubacteriales bacterium]MDN5314272.1 hypothetical protein [Clostridiales bacterium]
MKTDNVNVESFVRVLKDCKGKIHLISDEGDYLIVDSYLSAVVGFQKIMHLIPGNKLKIHCEHDEDREKINSFLQLSQMPC